jgi:hypothetical protein
LRKTCPRGGDHLVYGKTILYPTGKKALRRACKKYKYPLSVLTDERQKPNKYTRMVRMEPEYSSGNVVYNRGRKRSGYGGREFTGQRNRTGI